MGEAFGLSEAIIDRILGFVQTRSSTHAEALAQLEALGAGSETLAAGVSELREVLELLRGYGVPEKNYAINFSIARGLDYYTGTVYETTLDDYPQIGSICSGGRYENLASHYSKSQLPGVGISIGATRLFWQLREAGILSTAESSVEALVGLMDEGKLPKSMAIAQLLRAGGINTRSAAGGEEARQAVPVRRSRRHPLHGPDRRRRSRARRGDGQGPASPGAVRSGRIRTGGGAARSNSSSNAPCRSAEMKSIHLDGQSLTREQVIAGGLWRDGRA